MLDDRLDDQLEEGAREHNEPPETPRDAMWAAIVASRATTEKTKRTRHLRPFLIPAGIAAILALGVGLGRLSAPTPTPAPAPAPPVVASEGPRARGMAYQVAAAEHLSQSEAFLTLFRTSVRKGGNEQLASATARQLLATNRLLLDSPAATDTHTRLLLQDLELVLAEIAQLSPQARSRDLDLITEGMERGGMMSRLRTAVPSGSSTTQGAL
jgi:hypothetical protein